MATYSVNLDDKDALQIVNNAHLLAKSNQTKRNIQYGRDYLLNRAFVDMASRNSSLPHIAIPKVWSINETNSAREMKALFGSAPFIEFGTKWEDFKGIVESQNTVLHDFLERGNFYTEAALACKIKGLYGTAFMESEPYRTPVIQSIPIPDGLGGFNIKTETVNQLCMRITTYAGWEVWCDPIIQDLETKEGCGWLIKFKITSRRLVKKAAMADPTMYPGLDPERIGHGGISTQAYAEHEGYKILESFGLTRPESDDDVCILMKFESPSRYITTLNGEDLLRDGPNPYSHGMVNLSRWPHILDAHTQNRFWAIGEAKPNEVMQNMLSDAWSLLFQNWAYATQPAMLFRDGPLSIDDLIMSLAHRIPVREDQPNRSLDDYAKILEGPKVSKDQYEIISRIERVMDQTASSYGPQRGEVGQTPNTATEIDYAKTAGDVITESKIKLGEEVFLKSFGYKTLSNIDQFATVEDLVPILGEEKAYQVYTMNPQRIPGGVHLIYKGSSRITNVLIKQRNLKDLADPLMKLFQSGQFEYARILLESHELDKEEIDRIVGSAEESAMQQAALQEEQMQMQQQQARAQQQQAGQTAVMQNDQAMQDRNAQMQQAQQKNRVALALALIKAQTQGGGNGKGGKSSVNSGRNVMKHNRRLNREVFSGMLQ